MDWQDLITILRAGGTIELRETSNFQDFYINRHLANYNDTSNAMYQIFKKLEFEWHPKQGVIYRARLKGR